MEQVKLCDGRELKITSTNYSTSGSRWNGVSAYVDGILIARTKTTARHGSLNYIRQHPRSRYRAEFVAQLQAANVPDDGISAVVKGG